MAHVLLHDPQRVLFAVVPEKGPVSVRLTIASTTALYDAIQALHRRVEELRPHRPFHSVLLDVAPTEEPLPSAAGLNVVLKTFAGAQFTVAGILKSERADALSEASDLLIQEGAMNATSGDLSLYQFQVEEEIRLAEEAVLWDQALTYDAVFNAKRHLDESAQVWDDAHEDNNAFDERVRLAEEARLWAAAILEDRAFNDAEASAVWDEAVAENAAFDLRKKQEAEERERKRLAAEEAAAWNEALIENDRFDEERHRQEEAKREKLRALEALAWATALEEDALRNQIRLDKDWDEAIVHNALVDRACELARQTREAVLNGLPLSADVQALIHGTAHVQVAESQVVVESPAVVASDENLQAEDEEADAEDDGGVALAAAPVASPTRGAVVTSEAGRARPTKLVERWLRSGVQEYAEGADLTIRGNVSSGAEAIADGNINVWGTVNGRLCAGAKGDVNARIFCQKFNGEMVSIADRYCLFPDIPEGLRNAPVMFWYEDGKIHFRLIDVSPLPAQFQA